jgi:NADH-quinone oxidoreductase subunit J
MTVLGQAYFYICALIALGGALGVVLAKNPIRGAMGLLVMILAIAGLFLALHAQFLAAIQLIVYAGAIVVLFLFVIMLLGPSVVPPSDNRGRIPRAIGAGIFGASGVAAIALLIKTAPPATANAPALLPTPPSDFGGVDSFGRILFTQGILPFELSSALLMVAIVGAVAVARGRAKHEMLQHTGEGLTADDVPMATAEGAPRSPGGITREAKS